MSCEFAHSDGAYVLGSLSAVERAEFERHLADCSHCSPAVRDLAGLPGLLARVPLEAVEAPPVQDPPPGSLLPSLVKEVRRERRRRRSVAALAAAAVVVLAVGASGVVLGVMDRAGDDAVVADQAVAPAVGMESLGSGWVEGWVSLSEREWGTRIEIDCSYRGGSEGEWASYIMVVHGVDGETEQVGSWRAESGGDANVVLATAIAKDDIASLVVRTEDGRSVMRLLR